MKTRLLVTLLLLGSAFSCSHVGRNLREVASSNGKFKSDAFGALGEDNNRFKKIECLLDEYNYNAPSQSESYSLERTLGSLQFIGKSTQYRSPVFHIERDGRSFSVEITSKDGIEVAISEGRNESYSRYLLPLNSNFIKGNARMKISGEEKADTGVVYTTADNKQYILVCGETGN